MIQNLDVYLWNQKVGSLVTYKERYSVTKTVIPSELSKETPTFFFRQRLQYVILHSSFF